MSWFWNVASLTLPTMFLFIFVSNWSGALIPWKIIELPHGELGAPTNDINTTAGLALLTSTAYFYAGIAKKGLGYFQKYVEPTPILLPINILEDFTKPLSLSFRLFGNILVLIFKNFGYFGICFGVMHFVFRVQLQ